eukprot:2535045-Amphidinium_carterae.1
MQGAVDASKREKSARLPGDHFLSCHTPFAQPARLSPYTCAPRTAEGPGHTTPAAHVCHGVVALLAHGGSAAPLGASCPAIHGLLHPRQG